MSRIRKSFRLGGYLTFSNAKSLSAVSVQTPFGRLSTVNSRRLVYEHHAAVKAGDSVGRNFYFLRFEEGLDSMPSILEELHGTHLRPAIMSETFSLACLPFSQIRKAAIQTVETTKLREFKSFEGKVCLLCAGTDMHIEGCKLNTLMVCEEQVPVMVNAINTSHSVHHKVCIPVTDDVFGRWPPKL